MSWRDLKFNYFGDLNPYAMAVAVIGSLPWFFAWANPSWLDLLLIFTVGGLVQPGLVWISRLLHTSQVPGAKAVFALQRDPSNIQALESLGADEFDRVLSGWATRRVLYFVAPDLLRCIPIALFVFLGPVQRMPEPSHSLLMQILHFLGYLGFTALLVFIEQSMVSSKIRSVVALHSGQSGLNPDLIPWPVQKQLVWFELFFASASWISSMAVAYITLNQGHAVVHEPGDVFFLPVFGLMIVGGTWACTIVLLRQQREKELLRQRLDEYATESKWIVQFAADKARFNQMGEFAGLVVHDLAASLGTIKLALEGLVAKSSHLDAHDVHLRALTASSAHMESLLKSLRSRLRNLDGKDVGKSQLGNCIDHAVQLLHVSTLSMRSHLQWKVEVSSEVRDCVISMPQTVMMQIIMNLAANSVRAAGERPEVTIRVALVRKENDFAEISLRDDGGGLTQGRFDMLTRPVKVSRESVDARQGLGLRLVCRLLEQYGGSLSVSKDSGVEGTHMIIRLPCLD